MVCSCFTKIGCPQTQRSDKNYCINISILGWSIPHNRANNIFPMCKNYFHFPIVSYFSLCSRSFWKTRAWTPHHEFQILLSSSCSLDPSGGQKTVPRQEEKPRASQQGDKREGDLFQWCGKTCSQQKVDKNHWFNHHIISISYNTSWMTTAEICHIPVSLDFCI